jgi:hypothetical protein
MESPNLLVNSRLLAMFPLSASKKEMVLKLPILGDEKKKSSLG